jgi:plasmid replication initiation protein
MAATPYEILTFVGRGTGARNYDRLKAALDRLQSTTVQTSIRQPAERRRHRFSWINEWKETSRRERPPARHRVDPAGLVLCRRARRRAGAHHRPRYFDLTGGLERWLYRLVRKHGGRQAGGWSFDFCICTPSPAASRRSSISPTICARSCAARRCRVIGWSSSMGRAVPSVSPSRRSSATRS